MDKRNQALMKLIKEITIAMDEYDINTMRLYIQGVHRDFAIKDVLNMLINDIEYIPNTSGNCLISLGIVVKDILDNELIIQGDKKGVRCTSEANSQ